MVGFNDYRAEISRSFGMYFFCQENNIPACQKWAFFMIRGRLVRWEHRRAPFLLEGTQEKLRAREMQSTESYRTDSRIRLGIGAYRRYVPFPFPASLHFSQEGTDQARVPSMSYNTAGAILWTQP